MASGTLGSADVSATTNTVLYTCPTSAKTATVNVNVCNRNSTAAVVQLAVSTGVTPSLPDYLEFNVEIPANGVLERSGLVISAAEKVIVYSNVSNISARVFGFEE